MKFEKASDKILSSRERKTDYLPRKRIRLSLNSEQQLRQLEANGFRGKVILSLSSYNYIDYQLNNLSKKVV